MDEQKIAGARPQWEHHIEYIQAEAYVQEEKKEKGFFYSPPPPVVKDFLKTYYPKQWVPTHAVQAILPRINQLGAQGWELVQVQPVAVLADGKININAETFGTERVTHTYLCAFKRLKRSAEL